MVLHLRVLKQTVVADEEALSRGSRPQRRHGRDERMLIERPPTRRHEGDAIFKGLDDFAFFRFRLCTS